MKNIVKEIVVTSVIVVGFIYFLYSLYIFLFGFAHSHSDMYKEISKTYGRGDVTSSK
jgi:hypothetical protein